MPRPKKHTPRTRPIAHPPVGGHRMIPAWYRETDRLVTSWQDMAADSTMLIPPAFRRALRVCAKELHDAIHRLAK